jgi:hypothetical protein
MFDYSISPSGGRFKLPGQEDYDREFKRLQEVVSSQRAQDREIVLVMGLGFVGAVMAAVVADAKDEKGNPTKFVIGM